MWIIRELSRLIARIAVAVPIAIVIAEFRALGGVIFRGWQPKPEDPRLTANAVFIGSGIVLLVLGVAL